MAEHNQRFETFDEWVNKASSWLTRHPEYSPAHQRDFRAICFDSKGRICRMGSDFMKAEFPVHWVWPDQNLFEAVQNVTPAKNPP